MDSGPEDFVSTLYRRILLREPDSASLSAWAEKLRRGDTNLDGLLALFLESDEFGENFRRFQRTYGSGKSHLTNDHSQNGEFIEILRLMVSKAAPGGIVVDVGANGRERSNSYDFLKNFGWKGLLIEANPVLAGKIKQEFEGLDFDLVSVAVSDEEGTGFLSLGVNSDISSLDSKNTAAWGPISGAVQVPMRRLASILDEYNIPPRFDLLTMDIEGYDARVLNDLICNSDYRPQWIIIEGSCNFTVSDPRQIGVSDFVCDRYSVSKRTVANLILDRIETAETSL